LRKAMDIKKVQQLNLKPGDYIIVSTKDRLLDKEYIRLKRYLEHVFDKDVKEKGVRILVLDRDIKITKLRVKEILIEKEQKDK